MLESKAVSVAVPSLNTTYSVFVHHFVPAPTMKSLVWVAALVTATPFVAFSRSKIQPGSFLEQFQYDTLAESGWVANTSPRHDDSLYLGEWAIEESKKSPGFEGDRALVMKSEAAFHGLSKKLDTPVVHDDDHDLVLQFEVKFQYGITCGGAYLKLVGGDVGPLSWNDVSPYKVLFGPDICGSQNRLLFIITKQQNGETMESKLRTPPMARENLLSNLYTLIVRKNMELELRINGQTAKAGHLLHKAHFLEPALGEADLVPDMLAQKPDDWDERQLIFDPDASKPEDWDSTFGSKMIPDPSKKKPELWNEEAGPEFISTPGAHRPELWDDDEDGIWEPPTIRNPDCLHGCGPWEQPMIVNPNYEGEWVAPVIANPNYKGKWERPQIPNPSFDPNADLHVGAISGLVFDLWSMQVGILFDNIYLGNSVADAELLGNLTFEPKLQLETESYNLNMPKAKHPPKAPPKSFEDYLDEDGLGLIFEVIELLKLMAFERVSAIVSLSDEFKADPVQTFKDRPLPMIVLSLAALVAFLIFVGVANVIALMIFMRNNVGNKKQVPNKPTEVETEAKRDVQKDGANANDVTEDVDVSTATTSGVEIAEVDESKLKARNV